MTKPSKFPNLSKEIKESRLNQEELGKILGVTPLTIRNKLKGKRDWTLSEINTLCSYYNKDFYELFKKVD